MYTYRTYILTDIIIKYFFFLKQVSIKQFKNQLLLSINTIYTTLLVKNVNTIIDTVLGGS